jgi:hypothetical protein
MISIFEVFSVNRNEEDFLENLYILKEIYNEELQEAELLQEGEGSQERQQPTPTKRQIEEELERTFPQLQYLHPIYDFLSFEEFHWLKQQITTASTDSTSLPVVKKIDGIIQVYQLLKDQADFIHSLKQLYKKMHQ